MITPPGRKCGLAVIADDLTGSCDTAAQFTRYGMRVAMTGASAPELGLDLDLLVVNTASRGLPVEGARRVAGRAARSLLTSGSRPVYKKIDSTLKGPWCQELAAVMAVVRPDLAIVAPAFPAWGRTTRGGKLLLDGRPAHLRSVRGAGASGIDSGDLLGRLRAEFGSQAELLRRDLLRRAPAVVEQRIRTAFRKGHRVLLFDIESDSDLESLALTGRRLDEAVLWVGSAGLARFLPLSWGQAPTRAASSGPEAPGPVLLICGSLNPVNRAQLERLGRRGLASVTSLWDEDTDSPPHLENKLKPALEALARKQSVALCLRLEQRIRSRSHLQRLQQALQSAAARLLETGGLGATILVGGDTALK
ncbi:MAG: four-carbon acid sugar kinase family protein, partial [Acidobacteria bacterium]|nr:four-carbon acid sugar kinase family protein [Acidobacteriota bacterium]